MKNNEKLEPAARAWILSYPQKLFLDALLALVLLAAADIGARYWFSEELQQWEAPLPREQAGRRILQGNPYLIFEYAPGEWTEEGVSIRINSLGLRGPEVHIPKPSSHRRIMTIGDSTLFGFGVPEKSIFSTIAANILNQRTGNQTIEAINGAIPGYSTFQSINLLQLRTWKTEPDLLIIGSIASDMNYSTLVDKELIASLSGPEQAIVSQLHGLLTYSALYRVADWRSRVRKHADKIKKVGSAMYQTNPNGTRRVAINDYATNLEILIAQAQQRGVDVLFLLPANINDLVPGTKQNQQLEPYRSVMRDTAKRHGLPIISMPTLFQESGHTSKQLFLDPVHPSILGHRIVGEEAARILARWAQGVPIERNPSPLAQPSYSDPFSHQKDGSRRAQTDTAKTTTVKSSPQPRNQKPTFELLGCTRSFRQATDQGDVACVRAGKGLSFVSIEIDVASSQAAHASARLLVMQTELTQGFYKRLLPDAKVPACTPQNNLAAPAAGQPLYCVSFIEAIQLANLVSKKAGLSPCYRIASNNISMPEGLRCAGYRLPTMVEWQQLQGREAPGLDSHAWYAKNSGGRTHPVAEKQPDPRLLYDIFGNVSEWVWSTTESPSPSTPKRQAMGGSAGDSAESLRAQDGQALSNDQGDEGTGFRLVRTIP